MSAELIGILSVGAALFAGLSSLILTLQARTDKRLDGFDKRLEGFERRLDGFGKRLDGYAGDLRRLTERVARLEGLLKGAGLFRGAPSASGD